MIDIRAILEHASDKHIADALDESFKDVVKHYAMRAWRSSGLDSGHFVEAVRRFLEFRLTGRYTPFSKSLPKFNDAVLKAYENASGDESYRVLIPRILYGAFAIRNKRGIGHKSTVSPNEMDATYLLHVAKWVVAELVRLNSSHGARETEHAVANLVRAQIPLVWDDGKTARVLDPKMPAREQILLLLALRGKQAPEALQASVDYKNKTNFTRILQRLHEARLVETSPSECELTPLGFAEAEKLAAKARLT